MIKFNKIITNIFKKEGVNVLTAHKAKEFRFDGTNKIMIAESEGKDIEIDFDEVLVAIGRKANISGFGI